MDAPDFDPASATVTELIRFMSGFGIEMPASRQKKAVYVSLFAEHRHLFLKKDLTSQKRGTRGNDLSKESDAEKGPESRGKATSKDDSQRNDTPRKDKFKVPDAQKTVTPRGKVLMESNSETLKRPLLPDQSFTNENPFQSPGKTPAKTSGRRKVPMTPGVAPLHIVFGDAAVEGAEGVEFTDIGNLLDNEGVESTDIGNQPSPTFAEPPTFSKNVNLQFSTSEPPSFEKDLESTSPRITKRTSPKHSSLPDDSSRLKKADRSAFLSQESKSKESAFSSVNTFTPSKKQGKSNTSKAEEQMQESAFTSSQQQEQDFTPSKNQVPVQESVFMTALKHSVQESTFMAALKQSTPSSTKSTPGSQFKDKSSIKPIPTPTIVATPFKQADLNSTFKSSITSNRQTDSNASFKSQEPSPKPTVKPTSRKSTKTLAAKRYKISLFVITALFISVVALAIGRMARYYKSHASYCEPLHLKDTDCIPCPPNAICTDRIVIACTIDYRLQNSWIAYISPFNLPFPHGQPTCILDNERIILEKKKYEQVSHLIDMLDTMVRSWIGDIQCGSPLPQEIQWVKSTKAPHFIQGMPQSYAKAQLRSLIGTRWTDAVFNEHWNLLMDRMMTDEECALRSIVDDTTHSHRLLASSNPSIHSFTCRIRKHTWRLIVRFAPHLIILGLMMSLGYLGVTTYTQHQAETVIVLDLVENVTDAIHSEQESNHLDPVRHPMPGLSITQLRDHFLPVYSTATRDALGRKIFTLPSDARTRIWKRVGALVVRNSNVRESVLQVKGEAHRVWMWIGSSALSPVKKRKVTGSEFVGGQVDEGFKERLMSM